MLIVPHNVMHSMEVRSLLEKSKMAIIEVREGEWATKRQKERKKIHFVIFERKEKRKRKGKKRKRKERKKEEKKERERPEMGRAEREREKLGGERHYRYCCRHLAVSFPDPFFVTVSPVYF